MAVPVSRSVKQRNGISENEEREEDSAAQAYLKHLLEDGAEETILTNVKMEMPDFYDAELFEKAQQYMKKYRFIITSGMLMGLIAVFSVPTVLTVLIFSGQSSTPKTAYKRYLRTIFHTQSWYYYPVSNDKFWTSLRAVHRAHLHSNGASKKAGIGSISQKDLVLTQFCFIAFYTIAGHRVQLYDEEFFEASGHMWRVLGRLLGIKDEYNICAETWKETEQRLQIVMKEVYRPSLANTSAEFEQMAKALLDGLWTVNTTISVGSFLYYTKRLANVPGYEYYEFDYLPGQVRDANQKLYYKDLSWSDRINVAIGLFIVTYLHKYAIVRSYLNFRVWLGDMFMYYFPYIAFFTFGIKDSIVRIFKPDGTPNDYKLHSKFD